MLFKRHGICTFCNRPIHLHTKPKLSLSFWCHGLFSSDHCDTICVPKGMQNFTDDGQPIVRFLATPKRFQLWKIWRKVRK